MPFRHLDYPGAWFTGLLSSSVSVMGVVTQDNAMALAAALVAVGAVLSQPALNALRNLRKTLREERAKDVDLDMSKLAEEVKRRAELEYAFEVYKRDSSVEIAKLQDEIVRLTAELAKLRKATVAVNHRVDAVRDDVAKVRSSDSIPTTKGNPK